MSLTWLPVFISPLRASSLTGREVFDAAVSWPGCAPTVAAIGGGVSCSVTFSTYSASYLVRLYPCLSYR